MRLIGRNFFKRSLFGHKSRCRFFSVKREDTTVAHLGQIGGHLGNGYHVVIVLGSLKTVMRIIFRRRENAVAFLIEIVERTVCRTINFLIATGHFDHIIAYLTADNTGRSCHSERHGCFSVGIGNVFISVLIGLSIFINQCFGITITHLCIFQHIIRRIECVESLRLSRVKIENTRTRHQQEEHIVLGIHERRCRNIRKILRH